MSATYFTDSLEIELIARVACHRSGVGRTCSINPRALRALPLSFPHACTRLLDLGLGGGAGWVDLGLYPLSGGTFTLALAALYLNAS